jgi:hypothetical protein
MGRKKNKNANVVPDTYIEADPVEASEEARKSGDAVPESALGKKLASAGSEFLHLYMKNRLFSLLS